MSQKALKEQVRIWINGDEDREKLLMRLTPISESTLTQFLRGRYIPSPLLSNALQAVMANHPLPVPAQKLLRVRS